MPPHVHTDFVVPPLGCGRSVTDFWGCGSIGRSYVAPMMWVMICMSVGCQESLKPKFYRLPRPWSLWGTSSARENSGGRTENRTRDLMVSSQKFWPPTHEVGHSNLSLELHFLINCSYCSQYIFHCTRWADKYADKLIHTLWNIVIRLCKGLNISCYNWEL
jgi:hypothetical protein